jgi:DNA transformation protein
MMQTMPAKKADSFKDFVLDQLRDLPALSARPMFGGHGLYLRDRFFGIIYKGQLYFRVSPKTLSDYTSRGSRPFVPFPDRPAPKKQTMNSYYEVPAEVLENSTELVQWATKSAASARAK